jgi:hypothetical protein
MQLPLFRCNRQRHHFVTQWKPRGPGEYLAKGGVTGSVKGVSGEFRPRENQAPHPLDTN